MFKKGHVQSPQTREKIRQAQLGEKGNNWKNKVTYSGVHSFLRKNKNKIDCEKCGSVRFLEYALKKGKTHQKKTENYIILCSSCHKKYDYTKKRKAKLSESLKKVVHTKEWVEKISKALKGKTVSTEAKKKMSIYRKKNPLPRNELGQFYGKS